MSRDQLAPAGFSLFVKIIKNRSRSRVWCFSTHCSWPWSRSGGLGAALGVLGLVLLLAPGAGSDTCGHRGVTKPGAAPCSWVALG